MIIYHDKLKYCTCAFVFIVDRFEDILYYRTGPVLPNMIQAQFVKIVDHRKNIQMY